MSTGPRPEDRGIVIPEQGVKLTDLLEAIRLSVVERPNMPLAAKLAYAKAGIIPPYPLGMRGFVKPAGGRR